MQQNCKHFPVYKENPALNNIATKVRLQHNTVSTDNTLPQSST